MNINDDFCKVVIEKINSMNEKILTDLLNTNDIDCYIGDTIYEVAKNVLYEDYIYALNLIKLLEFGISKVDVVCDHCDSELEGISINSDGDLTWVCPNCGKINEQ